jgi:hypothetical protein
MPELILQVYSKLLLARRSFHAILSSKFITQQFLGGKLEIQVEELGVYGFLADILAKCVCETETRNSVLQIDNLLCKHITSC